MQTRSSLLLINFHITVAGSNWASIWEDWTLYQQSNPNECEGEYTEEQTLRKVRELHRNRSAVNHEALAANMRDTAAQIPSAAATPQRDGFADGDEDSHPSFEDESERASEADGEGEDDDANAPITLDSVDNGNSVSEEQSDREEVECLSTSEPVSSPTNGKRVAYNKSKFIQQRNAHQASAQADDQGMSINFYF